MRVAVLGLTQDHIWSKLRKLVNVAGAEIVAAAEHGTNWSEKKQKSHVEIADESRMLKNGI